MSDVVATPLRIKRLIVESLHLEGMRPEMIEDEEPLFGEGLGLDESNQYRHQELFRFEATGTDAQGRIQGKLIATGKTPSFTAEVQSMGLGSKVKLTAGVFGIKTQ